VRNLDSVNALGNAIFRLKSHFGFHAG